jgi:hypothetical protein
MSADVPGEAADNVASMCRDNSEIDIRKFQPRANHDVRISNRTPSTGDDKKYGTVDPNSLEYWYFCERW